MTEAKYGLTDIKPSSPIRSLDRSLFKGGELSFPITKIAAVVGMSVTFIKKIVGHSKKLISTPELLLILDQDEFSETFVPRSKILEYLTRNSQKIQLSPMAIQENSILKGCALELLQQLPVGSIQCTVTSTPYWGMRIYEDLRPVEWADGEICPFGMEQTPEGFIRHSVEMLFNLLPAIKEQGSVWWNIMDTYNTRTQIRGNAAETLRAMQGKEKKLWNDHACRRYSAGHSYLKDGEQCTIPYRIADRASRLGYYVKSVISWTKSSSMPEPQNSRVSRNIEYVIHLTKERTPIFDKDAYLKMAPKLGGRNKAVESEKLSDFWYLPTSAGRDGHGAQFPFALPGRCIGLTSKEGDLVLDPFMGAGTTAIAAKLLGRNYIGFDVSQTYIDTANERIKRSFGATDKTKTARN